MCNQIKPSIFIFYHYLPPDDVVSAVHFGDLSAGLAEHGWDVSAFPTVWGCRDEKARFAGEEQWKGVRIRRLWRPRFRQSSTLGRMLNAGWMISRWSLLAFSRNSRPDVVIVGTDPILSVLVARIWKAIRPKTKIVHWCFDLYPEAAIADGILSAGGLFCRFLYRILGPAYRACDVVADLGPCMRKLLIQHAPNAQRVTQVPWALEEPHAPLEIDFPEREAVFGSAKFALLYSGNFGRAHSYDEILRLIVRLAPSGAKLAFSVRGNRESELRRAVAEYGCEARFVPFASEAKLAARLACSDVHVVTLRPEWTGMVVPSKFFGALSAGRPVLFCGSRDSSIAGWIDSYKVGWLLNAENVEEIAADLLRYADSAVAQKEMRERCFRVYQQHFSRLIQMEQWHLLLSSLYF